MIRVHIERMREHALKRPVGYMAELRPALVRTEPGGILVYDNQHPAWKAAVKKYSGVQLQPRTRKPCGCGEPAAK
jgi:hypothetical protein